MRMTRRRFAGGVALGLVALNVVACLHARAMLTFVETGARTDFPERLSALDKARVLLTGVTVPRPRIRETPADSKLAAESVRVRTEDGLSLGAWVIPRANAGMTVVMHHGYAGSRSDLLGEAEHLAARPIELVLADFRGCGEADGALTTIGLREALDVKATWELARKRAPGRPVVLLGQSMGAAAILRAIAFHGVRPDGIVLEAPFDTMLRTVGHRFSAMGLPAFPLANLLVLWGGWHIGHDGFAHNPAEYARAVACPALVLVGDRDRRVSVDDAERVHAALPGWKRMKVFRDGGHLGYARTHLTEWMGEVDALFSAVSPPGIAPRR
jgi:pimeloyl-ACP methyl ester carboxylesterase